MKVVLFFMIICISPTFAQKPDSLSLARLKVDLSSFKPELANYSEKLKLQSRPDSIRVLCSELRYKTGVLLNEMTKAYGMRVNPYLDYVVDRAVASTMKDVSPELAGVYETNALLKFLDEPKQPHLYKQLIDLNKLADKTAKIKNAKKLLEQSKKLVQSCQALHYRL